MVPVCANGVDTLAIGVFTVVNGSKATFRPLFLSLHEDISGITIKHS